jgi:FMN reductase
MYAPHELERTPKALELVSALRDADAVVVGSPGYHGAVSGLVKNALDYIEDLREDPRVYPTTRRGVASAAHTAGRRRWNTGPDAISGARTARPANPLGVAIVFADEIWDDAGGLADSTVQSQLDQLATQLLTRPCAWERRDRSPAQDRTGRRPATGHLEAGQIRSSRFTAESWNQRGTRLGSARWRRTTRARPGQLGFGESAKVVDQRRTGMRIRHIARFAAVGVESAHFVGN